MKRSWRLDGSQLVERPAESLGKVSIQDISGEWKLVELPDGTPVPDGITVTLSFTGNTASGSSGCNSYTGTVEEKEPGELSPGLFAGTQMFCEGPAMEVERAYLKALGSANRYTFLGTRLGIRYEAGDGRKATMLFKRAE